MVCFQDLRSEIQQRGLVLDKLSSRYGRLSPDDPGLTNREVDPLRETWQNLLDQLEAHMTGRREMLEKCRGYHGMHADVNQGVDTTVRDLEQIQASREMNLQDRLDTLQVRVIFERVGRQDGVCSCCVHYC